MHPIGGRGRVRARPDPTTAVAPSRLRRADQAAHHRAAARHHAAVDDPGRRRPARRGRSCVATLVGGTLAAGSANALNCYLDRDIDAVMRRTGHRPLARHEVSPRGALVVRSRCSALCRCCSIGLATNWLAGALTALAIAFYVLVYTMLLKRRTPQNIVWGGAAGCMPVLIGWAAVTGSLAWAPVVLFARRVLLDAAALLGAGDPLPRGLRARRRADAAGGRGASAGGPRDRRLLLADRRRLAGCSGRSPPAGSTACSPPAPARCCSSRRTGCYADVRGRGRPGRCGCSTCPTATWPSCSSPSPSTPSCADSLRRAGLPRSRRAAAAWQRSGSVRSRNACPHARDLRRVADRRRGRAAAHRRDQRVGRRLAWAVWNDPSVDWRVAGLVVIRSTWDYTGGSRSIPGLGRSARPG